MDTESLFHKTALPDIDSLMADCTICPRRCHADRLHGRTGFCGQTADLKAARASLHMWEEPFLSGTNGSGTVFFSGCNLKCLFCQNHSIAVTDSGTALTPAHLAQTFLRLQEKKANNINLVTPSHFVPQICHAIEKARNQGLTIPVVYNTGSYESVDTLKMLDGLVDIYLPDLKYFSPLLSKQYSGAEDYFPTACEAIKEMFRQTGAPVFAAESTEESDAQPVRILKKGMIVRHLILPGQTKDSKKILRYLHDTYGSRIYISIMNQYTPLSHVASHPELNRKITAQEYDRVLDFALRIGIENAFMQEGDTAQESFIPSFDGEGL